MYTRHSASIFTVRAMVSVMAAALVLSGCSRRQAFALPVEPVARAVTCGAVAWADNPVNAGGGPPPPATVLRVVHFALLAAEQDGTYNSATAETAGALILALHRQGTVFPAEARPACAQAFPASTVSTPKLPATPLDSTLECAMLIDYARARLGAIGMRDAAADYGRLHDRFAPYVTRWMAIDWLQGRVGIAWRNISLAAAAKLGQPAAVIEACRADLPRIAAAPPPPFATRGLR